MRTFEPLTSPTGQQHARVAVRNYFDKLFLIERQIKEQRERCERSG